MADIEMKCRFCEKKFTASTDSLMAMNRLCGECLEIGLVLLGATFSEPDAEVTH